MELINEKTTSKETKDENIRTTSLFQDNKVYCSDESNNEQLNSTNFKNVNLQLTTLYPSCANSPVYENVQQQSYGRNQVYGSQPTYGQPPIYSQQSPIYGQQQGYQIGPYDGGYQSFEKYGEVFRDPSIRRKFIQKVYALLSVQLLFTFSIVSVFVFSEGAKSWVQKNPWIVYLALAFNFGCIIALACCGEIRKKYPQNLALLSLYTLSFSILAGVIAARYDPEAVMSAFGMTAVITIVVSLFSMNTKFDFTTCGGVLVVLTVMLILFSLVITFLPIFVGVSDQTAFRLRLVYSSIAVLIFTMWLAYDTQVLVGGKKYQIGEEEYIFATLSIYIDIMQIFLNLLVIFGGSDR